MIPVENAHLQVAAGTHEGRSGKNNEDRYAVSAFQVSEKRPIPALLAVVSDGIGGHLAGEVAAEMAVQVITQAVASSDASHPVRTLEGAIIQASRAIREQAEASQSQRGMGATCACVWMIGDRLYTASVGDSRIYLIREGTIRQITTDHTWVQEAVEHGALTPEQARKHPNAHVIRRYLGGRQPVVPDVRLRLRSDESDLQAERNQGTRLRGGDRLLVCTDGLTDLVEDDEILAAMQAVSLDAAVQYLVSLANYRGGHDNTTVVALEYTPPERPSSLLKRTRIALYGCVGVAFVLLVTLLAAALLGWYFSRPLPIPLPGTLPGV